MGWIGCVRCKKFQCNFMAQTCALIAQVQPILHRFRVVSKHCQMHRNATQRNKTRVEGPLGWIGCVHCEKFQGDFMARTCALIAPIQPILHQVLCSNERLPNASKHYQMHQNMSLGSNGVDRVDSLQKNPTRIRGTNFCVNCSSSACFAPSFMQ